VMGLGFALGLYILLAMYILAVKFPHSPQKQVILMHSDTSARFNLSQNALNRIIRDISRRIRGVKINKVVAMPAESGILIDVTLSLKNVEVKDTINRVSESIKQNIEKIAGFSVHSVNVNIRNIDYKKIKISKPSKANKSEPLSDVADKSLIPQQYSFDLSCNLENTKLNCSAEKGSAEKEKCQEQNQEKLLFS